jgi:inner membrane protein
MATIFGHALVAGAGSWISTNNKKIMLWCCISSMIPDADVIGFYINISYESLFGHRGFSHSLFFALMWAFFIKKTVFKSTPIRDKTGITILVLLFLSTASHGVLDACTTGGKGVAFLSPFSNHRYFFPWRFITVSPIGAAKFIGERGLGILRNEAIFLGIPSVIALIINRFRKSRLRKNQ